MAMEINILQRTPNHTDRVDTDKIRQRLRQSDKGIAVRQRQEDSVDISAKGRRALEEKMSAVSRMEQDRTIGKLSSINSGAYGIINDFEKAIEEQGTQETKTDTFDIYVNKMASAYQTLKDRIEEKYASSDRGKEYYTADDGSMQELTKEKELEMLDKVYETHSRFMANNTQIWGELQDFKVQVEYHSGDSKKETDAVKKQNTDVKEQAYHAFMSAMKENNIGMLKQENGSLQDIRLNLGISSSARNTLNGIWDYYANL